MPVSLRAVRLSVLLACIPAVSAAQVITVRTIPVIRGDYLNALPSSNVALGGLSIAVPDTLLDVARNPAAGVRLSGARFVSFPSVYAVSEGAGGGRALPVGVVGSLGSWFGGFSIAVQSVDASVPVPDPLLVTAAERVDVVRSSVALPDTVSSHGNAMAFATLGRSWPAVGVSIGGGVGWSRNTGMDGIDQLYNGSRAIEQFGHATDFRVGALKEWPGSEVAQIVFVHARSDMTHEVIFLDPFWDPASQQTQFRARADANYDRTRVWGLHVEYHRPLGDRSWRIGWIATANRVLQPAVPEYALSEPKIANVPWDPGNAWAYNLGVGVGRANGAAQFGLEVVYEPIWSRTGNDRLQNDFQFTNAVFRMGFGDELPMGRAAGLGFQWGLSVRWIHYWLAQYDRTLMAGRKSEESWVEWAPAFGIALRLPTWTLRYQASVLQGTQRSGLFMGRGGFDVVHIGDSFASFSPGPGWSSGFKGVSVVTHQVSVSVPLGRLVGDRGAP